MFQIFDWGLSLELTKLTGQKWECFDHISRKLPNLVVKKEKNCYKIKFLNYVSLFFIIPFFSMTIFYFEFIQEFSWIVFFTSEKEEKLEKVQQRVKRVVFARRISRFIWAGSHIKYQGGLNPEERQYNL